MSKSVSVRGDHASRRCKRGPASKPQGRAEGVPEHDILVLARGTPARRVIEGVLSGATASKSGHRASTVILMEARGEEIRPAARRVFPISFADAARMLSHEKNLSGGADDFGFFKIVDAKAGLIRQVPSEQVVELVRA